MERSAYSLFIKLKKKKVRITALLEEEKEKKKIVKFNFLVKIVLLLEML